MTPIDGVRSKYDNQLFRCESCGSCDAGGDDADLKRVIDAWPKLPDDAKQAILDIAVAKGENRHSRAKQ
ncbi:MAG: hypothetical protein WD049_09830 [Candidatus Paceibacterota bacterium]